MSPTRSSTTPTRLDELPTMSRWLSSRRKRFRLRSRHRSARRQPRSAPGSKGKAAFTLRLDPERHLKLRLACAVDGRSAQQIVTDALDQLLAICRNSTRWPKRPNARGNLLWPSPPASDPQFRSPRSLPIIAGCAAPQSKVQTASSFKAEGRTAMLAWRRGRCPLLPPTTFRPRPTSPSARSPRRRATPVSARCSAMSISPVAGSLRPKRPTRTRCRSIRSQPKVILKLALAQIAQGKNDEAAAFLNRYRGLSMPPITGWRWRLPDVPPTPFAVLEAAAREKDADGRVRQNLALAYALHRRLDQGEDHRRPGRSRRPARRSPPAMDAAGQAGAGRDQVAALTGVTPAAPIRASRSGSRFTRPTLSSRRRRPLKSQPAPVEAAPVQVAEPAPVPQPETIAPAPPPADPVRVAAAPAPAPVEVAAAAVVAPEAPAAFAMMSARFAPAPKPAKARRAPAPVRPAALRLAGKGPVMQLGAYKSPQYVAAAWSELTRNIRRSTPICRCAPASIRPRAPFGGCRSRVSPTSARRSPAASC